MAMSASSMKSKVEAAYLARTGQTMAPGAWDALIDLCTGIIQEITANSVVTVNSGISVATTGSATAQTGSTTATGTGSVTS